MPMAMDSSFGARVWVHILGQLPTARGLWPTTFTFLTPAFPSLKEGCGRHCCEGSSSQARSVPGRPHVPVPHAAGTRRWPLTGSFLDIRRSGALQGHIANKRPSQGSREGRRGLSRATLQVLGGGLPGLSEQAGGAHGVCCQPRQRLLSHSPREVLGVCTRGACPETSLTPTCKSHPYHTAAASLCHTGGGPLLQHALGSGLHACVLFLLPGSWGRDGVRSGMKTGVLQAGASSQEGFVSFSFSKCNNILFS